MISEIIPEAYDIHGRKTIKPGKKRSRVFHPTFPIGRYLSRPLTKDLKNIDELRSFLKTCTYISDKEQFNKDEYWLPPEEFEKLQKGDCEDFALYAWRQLIKMGYKARFVAGYSGRYGTGHAWVTLERNNRYYICEPVACHFSRLPKLSMVRYRPEISIEWDGIKIYYFTHEAREYNPSFLKAFSLFMEWIVFWIKVLIKILAKFTLLPFKSLINIVNKTFRF
ncbi:MAG: transglutaminase-like cysteine peptidase [Deltaproteobacteria bacterium]|nr:transglutaminase-like cysteine peptidase [Deltaproteobacteria bacterium]